jgi:hypothetical protein
MDWKSMLERLDASTVQAFVAAAVRVVDALVIEAERGAPASAPQPRDYRTAELPHGTPPGGWLGVGELRAAAQRATEALAAEKWTDGFVTALQALALLGGAL